MGESRFLTSLMRPFYRKGRSASFQLPPGLDHGARILCIDTGDLAQMLFHVPLLNGLRRRHGDLQMDFLLPEPHASLVVRSGLAKQCMIYGEGQLSPWRPSFASLLRKVGTEGYDMAVVMSFEPRPRLELVALASGAALRLGPSHPECYPAINCEMKSSADEQTYLGDRAARFAPFLSLSCQRQDGRWPLPMDKVRHVAQQVHFHKPNPDQMLIGIDPGPGKTGFAFALDNLEFLVRQLGSQLVCSILPLGIPGPNSRLAEFTARLGRAPVGLPQDDLLDMILLLSQCDLFISGNTDFFHFAVALGIPSVGLFTAQDPACWQPRDRSHAQVLNLAKGEKVNVAVLMDAIEKVTQGRTSTASRPVPENRPEPDDDRP